jgi:FtsH-binding integral membrane protein
MKDVITLEQAQPAVQRKFMTSVYRWMVSALAVSGISAFLVAGSRTAMNFIFGNPFVFIGLIISELVLVFVISAKIRDLTPASAALFFFLYSVLNGVTLASIFLAYRLSSIVNVFAVTALMFFGMSLYGMKTKSDLRSAGRYLMMGLIGIVIASLFNIILRSSMMGWLVSMISVVVFTGLTAYDTQKLMSIGTYNDGTANFQKVAIIGALELYLDFINIFLSLLRLFGNRN